MLIVGLEGFELINRGGGWPKVWEEEGITTLGALLHDMFTGKALQHIFNVTWWAVLNEFTLGKCRQRNTDIIY